MAWTKEEFIEFCTRCGVDPKKALKEGHISLRGHNITGATLGSIAAQHKKIRRHERAIRAISEIQSPKREPDSQVALEKEVYGQTEGMESASPSFRISFIGLRVRPIDPDNFAAGCKGLVDGIVASGIIPDDNWKTTEITASQKKVTNWTQEATIVIVESL